MITNPEGTAIPGKPKTVRGNIVLGGQTAFWQLGPRKMEFLLTVRVELAMENFQPLRTVEGPGLDTHELEVCQHIRFNPLQPHLGIAQVICLNTEGDVFSLDQTVVALLELAPQHIAVLCPNIVVGISPWRDVDALGEVQKVGPLVDEGKLDIDRGIKVVQEGAIPLKDLFFVLRLGQLVVDIEELHRFGIKPVIDPANAVTVHFPIGNGLLGGLRSVLGQKRKQATFFR